MTRKLDKVQSIIYLLGVYTHGNKEKYEGDWDNDMKNGHGTPFF